MNIEFKTRALTNGEKIFTKGATAKESVAAFLVTFKTQKFSVSEWHNGVFKTQVCGNDPEHNYFYKKFESRKDALNFINS